MNVLRQWKQNSTTKFKTKRRGVSGYLVGVLLVKITEVYFVITVKYPVTGRRSNVKLKLLIKSGISINNRNF